MAQSSCRGSSPIPRSAHRVNDAQSCLVGGSLGLVVIVDRMERYIFSSTYRVNHGNHLTAVTVSMSEFRKNPMQCLVRQTNRPVAVLNHNRPAFYMVEPHFFEAMLEELADQDLYRKAASRLTERARAIEVDIDNL